jgi:hypothetical protein
MRENLPPAPGEAIAAAAEQEYHKDDDDDCCGVHGGEPTTNNTSPSIFSLPTPPCAATSRLTSRERTGQGDACRNTPTRHRSNMREMRESIKTSPMGEVLTNEGQARALAPDTEAFPIILLL